MVLLLTRQFLVADGARPTFALAFCGQKAGIRPTPPYGPFRT
jgi:hypothetical protein